MLGRASIAIGAVLLAPEAWDDGGFHTVPEETGVEPSSLAIDTIGEEQQKLGDSLSVLTREYLNSVIPKEKTAIYARLKGVYGRYVARYGIAPDVTIGADPDVGPPKPNADLEAYLDRQFTIIHDRDFPVVPAQVRPPAGARRRLVVVEFPTALF
jgi:hypothetical protein